MAASKKKLLNWMGGTAALGFYHFVVRPLPLPAIYPFAHLAARLAWYGVRRRIRRNLLTAFGEEWDHRRVDRVGREFLLHFVEAVAEVMKSGQWGAERIKSMAHIEGKEFLDEALSRGKGVIGLTAHLSNFPLAICRLAVEGYRVNVVLRDFHERRLSRLFQWLREKWNIGSIVKKSTTSRMAWEAVHRLRKGEIVVFLIDHIWGRGGVKVNFFNRPAVTPTGPVRLALRLNCPLVPFFCLKEGRGKYRVVIKEPFSLRRTGDANKDVVENVQALTSLIEEYVRRYPSLWFWLHRRWG